jgi:isopenicillin N synthase-like dioxygenase
MPSSEHSNYQDNLANASLPIVDLTAFFKTTKVERREFAARVDDICQSIGFLVMTNHGVPKSICDAAWSSAKLFFNQSPKEKLNARSEDAGCPRGYTPIEGESLGKTLGVEAPPDRKETFSIGPLEAPVGHPQNDDFNFFYGSNIWPKHSPEFRSVWSEYYGAMEELGAKIMQMLAAALQLDENYFVEYHSHHISALRTQNYPSLPSDTLPGQLRAGAHSDYGSVTILNPDPSVGGLEVKSPTGNWIKAPMIEDAFIVNLGDLMARWSNDRWVSTLHRVVEPEGMPGKSVQCRQSIAYFMNPNYDAMISAIPTCVVASNKVRHSPILAGQYLINKFKVSN